MRGIVILFRIMLKDVEGRPVVGTSDNMLGARVSVDVRPDGEDRVHPTRGGISVAPEDPARLPPHLRPIRLGGQCGLPLFRIEDASLGQELAYRPDPKKPTRHGMIEPAASMLLRAYQGALAATAPDWEVA